MKPKNVLIVYKKSTYQIYVLKRFKDSHEFHYEVLKELKNFLKDKGLRYRALYRSKSIDYTPYDLVISVGGDGTFLEAARRVKNQPILGINSDPAHSVGNFCTANPKTFRRILNRFFTNKAKRVALSRIKLRLNGKFVGVDPSTSSGLCAVNDILVGHRNPAAMSRYWIKIGRVKEEHRSSGLWISTPAGSTGAIRSAGGKVLAKTSAKIQYIPRELYHGHGVKYALRGGTVSSKQTITVGSLMRDGAIYVDGPHFRIPFKYGDVLEISRSSRSLRMIK